MLLEGEHAADWMKEQPYGDVLDNCRNGELDAGHAGPPCHCEAPAGGTTCGEELGVDIWAPLQFTSPTSRS